MQRISTKMKLLSLAILGLGGIALAGSASAQSCPSLPGAWSATNIGGGTSAATTVSGGYDGTTCRLQSMLGNSGTARAQVRDDSPSNEPHYRAQFIFDPSALNGQGGTNQATVFVVNAGTAFNSTFLLARAVYSGSGGGTKRLIFLAGCDNGTTGVCIGQVNLPTQAGPNRVEIDLTVGAAGNAKLDYWVSDLATVTAEGSPTGSVPITGGNAGWVGVNQVFLGLSAPTVSYRSVNSGTNAWFDQFDSRRSTFIGTP